jgi:formate--tetrahydrofolate ligase
LTNFDPFVNKVTSDAVSLLPIEKIGEKLGLSDQDLEAYGRYSAKVSLARLSATTALPKGKLILVTGITPTAAGEGKTVTAIGLAQAIEKLGKRSIVTLREPSLGPVFGVKGGATGGGKSQVLPAEKINLHFNGDKHAVAAAHNLLAAMIDAHLFHGNELGIDIESIFWPRTVDINDRALRQITVGLGGKSNGPPRNSRFVITAASEIMAILALAGSPGDCARRLNDITIGFTTGGQPVRAKDLRAGGAMMVLLNEAIKPNLVQTSEHTPALVHAGPFANIAHGTSSVIAQGMALQLAQYVVNEVGFAADLGAEKYLDIVMPSSGIKPAAAVLVATLRALRRHDQDGHRTLKPGLENLAKHVENLRKYRLPTIVALNRFPDDKEVDIGAVKQLCADLAVEFAHSDVYERGGAGGLELADKVVGAADGADLDTVKSIHPAGLGIAEKISVVATEIYGASGVGFRAQAQRNIEKFSALGFAALPVCIAKTQNSLSDDPKKLGAPKNWTLTITDAHLASGAGFIVAVAGNMLLMPGLPKIPQAVKMSVNEDGSIVGVG